ncbi:hypothetical protein [Acinetobacter colistiniresistens]|uniref:hypothetical protein n=1 Tax=Acinetobacter colistiniresistens TaxID=280145 RepID=UPI001250C8D7|nr:hypothetical protein [Acinetobacter colistiniresistens]
MSVTSHAMTKDEACRTSHAYKLYESADKIVIYRSKITAAQNAIADDDEAARIGGISNKSKRYKASQDIVRYTRWTNEEFAKYKQLGGTALNPESISKPKSPCW